MGPALVTNTFPYHVTLVTDASELPEIVGAIRATTRSRYVLCSYKQLVCYKSEHFKYFENLISAQLVPFEILCILFYVVSGSR